MLLLIITITILIFLIVNFILYKKIKKIKLKIIFKNKRKSLLIYNFIFFSIVIFILALRIYFRFLKMGRVSFLPAQILEFINAINFSFNCYNILILFLLFFCVINLLLFFILVVLYIKNTVKLKICALYLYFLQYRWFKEHIGIFSAPLIDFDFFLHKNLKGYLHMRTIQNINLYGTHITKFLITYIYPSILVYLVYFDILTNFGGISTIYYVLPWHFLYKLALNFLSVIRELYENEDFFELSEQIYKK
jgi:hypothetical protein